MGSSAMLWGWDDTNKVWVKIQVDVNGRLIVTT